MLRIYCIIISFLLHTAAIAQTDEIDVSSLPEASYMQTSGSIDRWGQMYGNLTTVGFRFKEDSSLSFSPSLIHVVLEDSKASYIVFPEGGSETDVFIYKINGMIEGRFDIDYTELKEKIFMWGAKPEEKAIQIDDLGPGYFYVSYVSCNYSGSYILHIVEKVEI
ncbi:MAG: hypothetical protein QNK23_09165 [Crocinitomicaceae bacterium]|nr:hypothetical protein [Crocinitomicaceae bacterium]